MLRSITVGRAGPDVTGDRCPPNLDHPFHETAATISGSVEGIGMVSRTSNEFRIQGAEVACGNGHPNVCYIFERSGAKIVNNNQFLGLIF